MTGYDIFFALLRSGLHERPLSPEEMEEVSRLSPKQWTLLIQLATRQTVAGLFYRAVTHLSDRMRLPSDIVLDLMAHAVSIERDSRHKAAVTEQIVAQFRAEGLSPVVMKGSAVASYYAYPFLRTAGDIDIYLPADEIRNAFSLLPEHKTAPDGSRHGVVDGIDIDLHSHYFDLHVPPGRLPQPGSPEATLLMLSAHIRKHATGVGIGLRQFCDLAAAWQSLSESLDRDILLRAQRTGRMRRWDRLAASFLARELDMPLMHEILFPGEKRADPAPLRRIVLEGGNFGHYADTRPRALQQGRIRRKRDTLVRFLRRLPFSLRYAPRETLATIFSLIRGNLNRITN